MHMGPLRSVQKLYLVIQRPSRQVVYFTGTQYLPKHFSHGTDFEFVPRGHKVLELDRGRRETQMSTWLIFILYKQLLFYMVHTS